MPELAFPQQRDWRVKGRERLGEFWILGRLLYRELFHRLRGVRRDLRPRGVPFKLVKF